MKYAVYTNGHLLCRVNTKRQAERVAENVAWLGPENVKIVDGNTKPDFDIDEENAEADAAWDADNIFNRE